MARRMASKSPLLHLNLADNSRATQGWVAASWVEDYQVFTPALKLATRAPVGTRTPQPTFFSAAGKEVSAAD
jgi:hypothetical protein